MMRSVFFITLLSILLFHNCEKEKELFAGKKISSSLSLAKDTFLFADATDDAALVSTGADPTLLIEGRDLVLDFGGSVLMGSEEINHPENFRGIGIHVTGGANITIKNLSIHGYAVALFAEEVENLHLVNCNFSYLRRKPAGEGSSTFTFPKEVGSSKSDWRATVAAGAGVILRNCNKFRLQELKIHHAQNGLILDNCNNGLVYNNTIQFNAGLGIGLFASNDNQILFNALDWNFASDSEQTRQGGLTLLGGNQANTIAYNSITHSGSDQLFYSANEDAGGSNNSENKIVANDFSYAPTYGVIKSLENGNQFANNLLTGCRIERAEKNLRAPEQERIYRNTLQVAIDSVVFPNNEKGRSPFLNPTMRKGCAYKIMDTYGPYDFSYPQLIHRGKDEEGNFLFTIFGPPGNWEAKGGEGFKRMSLKRGTIPATLVMQEAEDAKHKSIELEYIGPAFTDAFGRKIEKGAKVLLQWHE